MKLWSELRDAKFETAYISEQMELLESGGGGGQSRSLISFMTKRRTHTQVNIFLKLKYFV